MVEYLVGGGINVGVWGRTRSGSTALHYAVTYGSIMGGTGGGGEGGEGGGGDEGGGGEGEGGDGGCLKCIRLLISKGCPINARNNYGDTALHQVGGRGGGRERRREFFLSFSLYFISDYFFRLALVV